MEWISVKDRLPDFGVTVLWFTKQTWRTKETFRVFSDELSDECEILEYGESAYLLKNESDYLAYDGDYADDLATHWMPLMPLPNPPKP